MTGAQTVTPKAILAPLHRNFTLKENYAIWLLFHTTRNPHFWCHIM